MAMTKDDMAMIAMEIVAYAGDARTKYLAAMDAIGEKDFAKAEALIKEGDDLILNLNVDETGIITDGSFEGSGCAISQASADMMFDLIIGKSVEEAKELSDIFSRMIKETITEEELERLEEAGALIDISHMPARVKCAMLAWRTFNEMITAE